MHLENKKKIVKIFCFSKRNGVALCVGGKKGITQQVKGRGGGEGAFELC